MKKKIHLKTEQKMKQVYTCLPYDTLTSSNQDRVQLLSLIVVSGTMHSLTNRNGLHNSQYNARIKSNIFPSIFPSTF